MNTEPSFTQLVTQVVRGADRPLTLNEIQSRVEMIRPVNTANPHATLRNAFTNVRQIATLGGRPAHYTWWPRHLADNTFRQPLASSDIQAGMLAVDKEVWLALWPDFYGGASRSQGDVTLALADGPTINARIEHLVDGQAVWGLPPTPTLAEWYRQQQAAPEDALIVRVLDVDARRYAISLARHAERDEAVMAATIAARNQALRDTAEKILRAGRMDMGDFDLVPRLIAHNTYRDPLPPDPWDGVLRADLKFVVGAHNSVDLTERVVDYLEREKVVWPDPLASPRPRGDRREARSEKARLAWGAYLFDRGIDHQEVTWPVACEAYYREALRFDPGHADAWAHLGNRRFEEGRLTEALAHYERGQAAAEARTIGDPARYPNPFWLDLDSRPFMRALHGRGLCLWRLGRIAEARQVFAWMLDLNPNDNQGARFLLDDLVAGLSWQQSVERDEKRREEQEKAFRQTIQSKWN
ncbi:MAG: tetratricopeptide repeat protein [Anaerolineae bacterium]|nr:tetratricopeptide repeat protein [Anaerolineae bacterium]